MQVLPIKTVLCVHGALFFLANFASPLDPAWFWSNFLIILILLRLIDGTAAGQTGAVSEILVYIYLYSIVSDIVSFILNTAATSGQSFALAMACISMIFKPFLLPSIMSDMKARGGVIGGFLANGIEQVYSRVDPSMAGHSGGLVAPSDEPYQGGYQQENVQNDNTAL